jgi:hypothetical protein
MYCILYSRRPLNPVFHDLSKIAPEVLALFEFKAFLIN